MAKSRFTHTRKQTGIARELRRETSRTEARLWPRLRRNRLGAPFRRQHAIGPYFADYCCVPLKLVVEVDGPAHAASSDAQRDRVMRQLGYDVMRFPAEEIDVRLEQVVEAIWMEVQERKARVEADPHPRP